MSELRLPEPRRPLLLAAGVFILAALALCWPMLAGKLLIGSHSDMFVAGYAFRSFAANYWKIHHAIPLWDPYLFGGIPFVGGMHGDIFYPTAWLRAVLPVGVAINLGFLIHLIAAGLGVYALLRAMGAGWAGAVTGGLAYELAGNVASMVHPGHDGKLYVAAVAPFLLLALLRAIRHRSVAAHGAVAVCVGLVLHAHPQVSYYLLVAAGIWTLFLVRQPSNGSQASRPVVVLAACLGAVALGFGLYAIQALPFWEYVPHSPRAATGPSTGWEYAIAYSLPPEELMTPILPQFNGMVEGYWGRNFFKLHTEYLGPLVVMLAIVGIRGPAARPERQALLVIAALFLLVSLGGHTPFYRLWYEVMPMMKKVRAAGMAFVLVALPVAVFAGLGADRVLGGQGRLRGVMTGLLAVAVLGLLGAVGGLQGLAESLASQATIERAIANAPALRTGGLRLLAVAIAGLAVCFLIHSGKLVRWAAAGALLAVVGADLWSIQRHFFVFGGTEQELFGDDEATAVMRRTAMPFRVLDPHGDRYGGLAAYPGSWLMGREIPQLLGYHGQELHRFDELLGGKSVWENQVNPALLSLFGIRYVVLPNEQAIPGFHKVLGPVRSRPGGPVVLYEADTVPPYARLMSAAVKAPAEQIPTLVTDPRFPALQVALYDESAPVSPQEVGSTIPAPPTAQARVAAWSPGRIRVTLEGSDQRTLYLLVAENWYRDWRVAIDGGGATALPAHGSMLSVPIPPGSREVDFEFRSDAYRLGRLLTLLSALIVAGLLVAPRLGRAKDGG